MKKITLTGRREFFVTDRKAKVIADLMLEEKENRPDSIEIEGQVIKFFQITGVFSAGLDPKGGVSRQDQVWQDFHFQEQEYVRQTFKEKAKRQYYACVLNLFVSAFGLKTVFGEDYCSPMLDHPFDSPKSFEFTSDQKQDRIDRFDKYMRVKYPKLEIDLKKFFLEFFERNPKNSWSPLEQWREVIGVPTTRFDKLLTAHQRVVGLSS